MTNKFKGDCSCQVITIKGKTKIPVGDSFEFDIFVYETPTQANPYDLTNSNLTFTAVDDPANPMNTLVKTIGDGIVVLDYENGHARVTLTTEDTNILGPFGGILFYDVKLDTPENTTYTVASGSLLLTPDVG